MTLLSDQSSTPGLVVDEPAPHVRRVTLNRPARMNALDGPTLQALHDVVLDSSQPGSGVRVLVIRGAGRAFCAGNDLKWLADGVLDDPPAHMRHQDRMQATFQLLEAADFVAVASVNGFALAGGFELTLACDIIVADEAAELGDEHIRRNLLPSGGSSQRLPRRIGLHRALFYLLTGRRMTGREAVAVGLAALAVPAEELDAETLRLAAGIAGADPLALASMKRLARQAMLVPLAEGLQLERWTQLRYRQQSASLEAGVRGFAKP